MRKTFADLLVCDECGRIHRCDEASNSESCDCGRFKQRMEWASAEDVMSHIDRLDREVELLRHYGNKDCTAMADEALENEAKERLGDLVALSKRMDFGE